MTSYARWSTTPKQRASAARTQRMVAMRLNGFTLEEISQEFGVSRERVRQITTELVDSEAVAKAVSETRERHARLAADEDRDAVMAEWRAGASTSDIAKRRGLHEVHVRRVVAECSTELERCLRRGGRAGDSDELRAGVVTWLRRFAAAHDGQTPSSNEFRDWKEPGRPEPSGFGYYFDSWNEACEAAGLPPHPTTRGTYKRRWSREDCLSHVRACSDALGRVPSYAEYVAYARSSGGEAPSGALVRFRVGRWKTVLTLIFADVEMPLSKPWSNAHLAPEQERARKAVAKAIQHGELVRPDRCSQCGKGALGGAGTIEAHHEDYAAPLDVIWLCFRCHRALHAAKYQNERAA